MAYGIPYFPTGYGQQYPTPAPIQQSQTTVFYNVSSEDDAYRRSVPPNTTANFINETQGYLYKKSMGMSILEPFLFERYKIVRDDVVTNQPQEQASSPVPPDMSEYMTKTEFESYKAIIDEMQKIVKELNGNG